MDPATCKRIDAALALVDQAMKKFGDAFDAGEHYPDWVKPMEDEGRQLLRTAYRDAPELIDWLPDMYADLDNGTVSFVYRSGDDEAVSKARARLAAESPGAPPTPGQGA